MLWGVFGLAAIATAVTYTRTPVRELYHVSKGGPPAGAKAVLGFAGFPAALMALAVLPRRLIETYSETKEALGGYFLIEAESPDEAISWAAKIPTARFGVVGVRPVVTQEAEVGA